MITLIIVLIILGIALEVTFNGIEQHSNAEKWTGIMLIIALIAFVSVIYGQ